MLRPQAVSPFIDPVTKKKIYFIEGSAGAGRDTVVIGLAALLSSFRCGCAVAINRLQLMRPSAVQLS